MRNLSIALLLAGTAACRAQPQDKDTSASVTQGGLETTDETPEEPEEEEPEPAEDNDGDGFSVLSDCDDTNPDIHPGATEVCNGLDDDCDFRVDELLDTETWYRDNDGDGWGDEHNPVVTCDGTGLVARAGDCNDADPDQHPERAEDCNHRDDNCNGEVDEGVGSTAFLDADADGFGDFSRPTKICTIDELTDHLSITPTDCDDSDAAVHPDATEVCNGIDDDCDNDIDDDDANIDDPSRGTWYTDGDRDGYGDPSTPQVACDQPRATVADRSDCDDTNSAIHPGASEVCNTIDDDCDGATDDRDRNLDLSTAGTYYDDIDGDGYGNARTVVQFCVQPSDTVTNGRDCDDNDADVNPGESEVCNGVDDDCDGLTDDDDTSLDTRTRTTFFADNDGDGHGDATSTLAVCAAPAGYTLTSDDCDDTSSRVYPGAREVWYDGIDEDCDGDDDYDADHDGDKAIGYGGGDCDDHNTLVYEGNGCRPLVSCVHPSTATLAAYDPAGVSDLAFDAACNAWVPTIVSSTDYVYRIDNRGTTTVYTGTSNHNIGSIALDPSSSRFAVGYNNVNYVGYSTGTSIPVIAEDVLVTGTAWDNLYLNQSPSSIAMDSAGCIWVPNLSGEGTLECVETDGIRTTVLFGLPYIESVALTPDESVYIAVETAIYEVDVSAGTTSLVYYTTDTILDFVVDYNDDLYVETDAGTIIWVPSDGSAASVFDVVSGQGKLAISPDGYLVRVIPNPVSAAIYEEWPL